MTWIVALFFLAFIMFKLTQMEKEIESIKHECTKIYWRVNDERSGRVPEDDKNRFVECSNDIKIECGWHQPPYSRTPKEFL